VRRHLAAGRRRSLEAHWVDDGPDEKLVFYWRGCGEREFGLQ
jgi:hypothetical protein